jgi:DNA-binding SARP family transcriptional activator
MWMAEMFEVDAHRRAPHSRARLPNSVISAVWERPTPAFDAGVSQLVESTTWLRLLGEFSLTVGGRTVPVGPGAAELLAVVALRGRQSRTSVQVTLWPDGAAALTAGRLRSLIYRVNHACSTEIVTSDAGPTIALNPALVVDYQVAAEVAGCLVRRRSFPAMMLADASRLLSSDLLPVADGEWLAPHQNAWSRRRLRALEACARMAIAERDWETVVHACEAVIVAEPVHERAHYLMIVALLREEYRHAARRAYDELIDLLSVELGCPPRRSFAELWCAAQKLDVRDL